MQFKQKLKELTQQVEQYSRDELLWFNGYLTGILQQKDIGTNLPVIPVEKPVIKPIVLYGTETGNTKKIALELAKELKLSEFVTKAVDLNLFKAKDLSKENYVILICSTQGEGEAPLSAQKFFDDLTQLQQDLSHVNYAILGIGDSSYPLFCQASKDLEGILISKSAKSIIPIQNLDTDYKTHTRPWINQIVDKLKSFNSEASLIGNNRNEPSADTQIGANNTKDIIYQAKVIEHILLNDRESNKKTFHLEIQCETPLAYNPGDAIGIIPKNSTKNLQLVARALGDESRYLELEKLSIVQLGAVVLKKLGLYLQIDIQEKQLDLLEVFETYNITKPFDFDQVKDLLLPIAPRLYSVSSSVLNHENQVHLSVGLNEFTKNDQYNKGLCSGYLSELKTGDSISFYVHENKDFHLPDSNTDIIMIGPGTGIAPFRAFLQHRDLSGANAKNWLFFGEQHFVCDFYYQTEIQQWLETGVLTQLHTAFSRDQSQKIYVQDRMLENAQQICNWIENGAVIYLCGQKNPMALDVEQTLIEILKRHICKDTEQAQEYLDQMILNGQFKKDVY